MFSLEIDFHTIIFVALLIFLLVMRSRKRGYRSKKRGGGKDKRKSRIKKRTQRIKRIKSKDKQDRNKRSSTLNNIYGYPLEIDLCDAPLK